MKLSPAGKWTSNKEQFSHAISGWSRGGCSGKCYQGSVCGSVLQKESDDLSPNKLCPDTSEKHKTKEP